MDIETGFNRHSTNFSEHNAPYDACKFSLRVTAVKVLQDPVEAPNDLERENMNIMTK